ncbi:MAG: DUF455 family protein [Polyangiaceae bacterium]|nr:DUF455 family protein [Polyangiaceae bacterium]
MLANADTVEAWAERYVLSESLAYKLSPGPVPAAWARETAPRRLNAPGRPAELRISEVGARVPENLSAPSARAKVLHTFFHHELQAAELMAWAILAFSDAELEFRKGLLRVCQDEVRHMHLYRAHIEALGHRLGDFKVRDWFWQRVPSCQTKVQFVALMGMGLEGANLEHASVFAEQFLQAGDHAGAALQQTIGNEEVAHVALGVYWFERWTGGQNFETWCSTLPAPLTPLLMRGKAWNQERRERAGMRPEFLERLRAWQP